MKLLFKVYIAWRYVHGSVVIYYETFDLKSHKNGKVRDTCMFPNIVQVHSNGFP